MRDELIRSRDQINTSISNYIPHIDFMLQQKIFHLLDKMNQSRQDYTAVICKLEQMVEISNNILLLRLRYSCYRVYLFKYFLRTYAIFSIF